MYGNQSSMETIYLCRYYEKPRKWFSKRIKHERFFTKKDSAYLFLKYLSTQKNIQNAHVFIYYYNNITTEYYKSNDVWSWKPGSLFLQIDILK